MIRKFTESVRNPLTVVQIAHIEILTGALYNSSATLPPTLIPGSLEFPPKFMSGGRFPRYEEKAQKLCSLRERKRETDRHRETQG